MAVVCCDLLLLIESRMLPITFESMGAVRTFIEYFNTSVYWISLNKKVTVEILLKVIRHFVIFLTKINFCECFAGLRRFWCQTYMRTGYNNRGCFIHASLLNSLAYLSFNDPHITYSPIEVMIDIILIRRPHFKATRELVSNCNTLTIKPKGNTASLLVNLVDIFDIYNSIQNARVSQTSLDIRQQVLWRGCRLKFRQIFYRISFHRFMEYSV